MLGSGGSASHPYARLGTVDVTSLWVRAYQELADLSPEPGDPHDHALWLEPRGALT
jgi:hypothetical protein